MKTMLSLLLLMTCLATSANAEDREPSAVPEASPSAQSSPLASPSPTASPAASPSSTPAAPAAKSQAAAPPSPPSNMTTVTRVVGEVGEHFVTSREVRINQAIEQALSPKPQAGDKILTGEEANFPQQVSVVLDEWMVYYEAQALSTPAPSKADIAKSVKTVQDHWSEKSAWTALEVSNEELRDMVERKMIAKQFEKLKSDPSLSPVSDEDALLYYKKNRLRFGSLPFESFRDNIKAYLVKSQTERRLSEWREILRRKYKVRNFIAG